jgi:hypothetical protein
MQSKNVHSIPPMNLPLFKRGNAAAVVVVVVFVNFDNDAVVLLFFWCGCQRA